MAKKDVNQIKGKQVKHEVVKRTFLLTFNNAESVALLKKYESAAVDLEMYTQTLIHEAMVYYAKKWK